MAADLPPNAAQHHRELPNLPLLPGHHRRIVRTAETWVSLGLQKRMVFPEHQHPWLQITVTFRGAHYVARWRQTTGILEELPRQGGQVWIVPPGVTHGADWLSDGHLLTFFIKPDWACSFVPAPVGHVSIEPLDRYLEAEPMLDGMAAFLCRQTEPLNSTAERAIENLVPAMASQLLLAHYTPCQFRHPHQWRLSRTALADVRSFIDEHLAEDLSLPVLSKIAGLSPSYFGQLFRAATGSPPTVFVTGYRLRRARQILQEGNHTVAEVAQLTGFSDQHQMAYHFRQSYGRPPSSFLPTENREYPPFFREKHQAEITPVR